MNLKSITPVGKIGIILLILVCLGALDHFGVVNILGGKKPDITVGVVDWGGYAGGEYFNRGFEPNSASMYWKKYHMNVKFVVINDFQASREAWKAGKIDLLWFTAESFPTEADALKMYDPRLVFQADWSRGGDAIVAVREIKSMNDLTKKTKVAVAFGTPSYALLMWALRAAGKTVNDIEVVDVPSAIDAATQFKAGAVQVAVVWSPDDMDCLANVLGSHILINSKQAPFIIADVFYAKAEFIKKNQKKLTALVEGWLIGAAEINSDPAAKQEAAKILSVGLGLPEDWCLQSINNARLTTYGDNLNFFGLNNRYTGVTGEMLYTETGKLYQELNHPLAPKYLPPWREVIDLSILNAVDLAGKPGQEAEAVLAFAKPGPEAATAPAFSTKQVTINFPSGSAYLDENCKSIIDREFAPEAKRFERKAIRIEGNTDSEGPYNYNKTLSYQRAQAVADYLEKEHHIDPNRFVVVGNGPDKPVGDNATMEGRAKNRRTDFVLVE